MRRLITLLTASAVLLVLVCPAAMAQEEVQNWSLGIGDQWGGIGGHYVSIDEGSTAGLSFGVGLGGASVGVPFLLGDGGNGLELTYSYGFWKYQDEALHGVTLAYGNFPVEKGDFVWRVGTGYWHIEDDWDWFPISLGFGWVL